MITNKQYYSPLEYKKEYDINKLRKTSNGLGFFTFGYFIIMNVMTVIILQLLIIISPDKSLIGQNTTLFLMNIFVSAFAAFIPSIFYFLFSGRNMSEIIKIKYVKLNLLIPIVFLGLGAAMFANVVSDIIASNFSIFGIKNTVNFSETTYSLLEQILYIIAVSLVPALAEEFAFRGVLMGVLRKYGDAFAIISSAVLFGMMHANISQIPFAFILGLVFAFVDCKTNSIIPSIIIHFLNNFYAVVIDILSNSNLINKNEFYIIYFIFTIIMLILSIISFIVILKQDKQFFIITKDTGVTYTDKDLISFKEKNKNFYLSFGVLVSGILFVIETIMNLGFINV